MNPHFDVAGIGAGPFNLSVAALLAPLGQLRSAFFDKRSSFDWHPGMMLPGAKLQTSFLKDLVTAADPTSGIVTNAVSSATSTFAGADISRMPSR